MAHFKQENNYGCGLCSVANALQNSEIISASRLDLSKEGNNIGQINKWLLELDLDLWVSTVKYDNGNPIEIFDLKPNFEADKSALWYPFLIVVKSTKDRNHMIGCRYMRDGSIIAHDSLMDEATEFKTFDEFKEHYNRRVLSYECFQTYKNENVVVIQN